MRNIELRRVALAVAGGSVGFTVLGNMLSVWEVPALSMVFWLLAGVTMSARQADADPAYRMSP